MKLFPIFISFWGLLGIPSFSPPHLEMSRNSVSIWNQAGVVSFVSKCDTWWISFASGIGWKRGKRKWSRIETLNSTCISESCDPGTCLGCAFVRAFSSEFTDGFPIWWQIYSFLYDVLVAWWQNLVYETKGSRTYETKYPPCTPDWCTLISSWSSVLPLKWSDIVLVI